MIIAKVLNNNIAVAVDDGGRDMIVMGCGVAFGKRHGDLVDEDKVDRLFTQDVSELSRRFGELTAEIPEEYFEAAQSIIGGAKMRLGRALDDSLYLSLTTISIFPSSVAARGSGFGICCCLKPRCCIARNSNVLARRLRISISALT